MTRTIPLSVCLVSGEYPPDVGGIADYTRLLAEQLETNGLSVAVIATGSEPLAVAASTSVGPIRVTRLPGRGPGTVLRLPSLLRTGAWDVVHLQYQAASLGANPFVHMLPRLLRARGIRARVITTFHDLRVPSLFPKAGPLRWLAMRQLIQASDGAIFTDPNDLIRAQRAKNAGWIPIGANVRSSGTPDRMAARARWGLDERDEVVAYFGFLNASKGVSQLLRAASRLINEGRPLRLLLVGEELGSADPTNARAATDLRDEAARLGLEASIVRTGWLDPSAVSEAFTAADLAALPYADGASLRRGSLLACFAHGLPVVTTQPTPEPQLRGDALVPPFEHPSEFRLDAKVAELVPRGDDAELAQGIRRLLDDPLRRTELSQLGPALAERLSWPRIGKATLRFYERVLGSTPRASMQ